MKIEDYDKLPNRMEVVIWITSYGSVCVRNIDTDMTSYGYTKISSPFWIEYELLPYGVIIGEAVKVLDAQIETIQTEAMNKIATLREKKAELLALAAPSVVPGNE